MKINDKTTMYVFCPANYVSGGPEALHQLCHYLTMSGYNAYMVYYSGLMPVENGGGGQPLRYKQYGTKTQSADDIEDIPDNVVIVPESSTFFLRRFKKVQKAILWLGWVCSDKLRFGPKAVTKEFLRGIKHCNFSSFIEILRRYWNRTNAYSPRKVQNLYGSEYACSMVSKRYFHNRRVGSMLVEPISKDFLDKGSFSSSAVNRTDTVLYNPAKPSKIMTELLKDPAFKFKPIINMTPVEIAEEFRKAKLYVDFGQFGGPERMPKEAVFNGCHILVVRHNAAVNDFDIAIPDRYKIEEAELSVENVNKKISEMLQNFDSEESDFVAFREKVENLETNYLKQINEIFRR